MGHRTHWTAAPLGASVDVDALPSRIEVGFYSMTRLDGERTFTTTDPVEMYNYDIDLLDLEDIYDGGWLVVRYGGDSRDEAAAYKVTDGKVVEFGKSDVVSLILLAWKRGEL